MQSDTSELTDKDFYGAVDRLVTNTALAGLALIPSVFIVFAAPWRMTPLIKSEPGSGRDGLLLAPGLFFLLSNVLTILAISLLTVATSNAASIESLPDGDMRIGAGGGVTIGSVDPTAIAAAWRSGEFNAIVTTVVPLFGLCVISFAATAWLKRLVGDWWTLRTAIRTGFYIFGAVLGISAILAAVLFRLGLSEPQVTAASSFVSPVLILLMPWIYYWVFKKGAETDHVRILIASVLAPFTAFLAIGLVVALLP